MADNTDKTRPVSVAFFAMVSGMFFLSGAVGLLYEIVWFRRLHLVFGVSSFAVGAVVAAFMLGLAAGSRWAGSSRWLRDNPLLTYAWLEVGIAVFALAFPAMMSLLEGIYVALFGLLEGHYLVLSVVRFLLGLLLLLPPTFMMGASLPAIAQAASIARIEMAKSAGLLYAINTFGAVTGTLIAGFYSLEHLGIQGSIHLGLGGNLTVAIMAFALTRHAAYRSHSRTHTATEDETSSAMPGDARKQHLYIAVAAVTTTGLTSMAAEIVWTRALAFFIHNSTYAFSSVLAVYLFGIAAGSFCGTRLVRQPEKVMRRLTWTLLGICGAMLLSIVAYQHLQELAQLFAGSEFSRENPPLGPSASSVLTVESWPMALACIFGQVAVVLLFPTFLFGMVFPLALSLAQNGQNTTASVVGKLYAANAAGSVVGVILGTFVLIVIFGTRLTLVILAWLPMPVAMWAMLKAVRRPIIRTAFLSLFPAILVVASILAAPAGFYRGLFERRFGEVLWFSEGVSETVAICRHRDGSKWIQYSDGRGASGTTSFHGGWLYAHLPLLLHPDPQSALIICFGTGNTLGAASRHELKELDCAELSSEVVKASHFFSETNHNVVRNPAVNIVIEDGRNYLLGTKKRYDVISEEPPLVHTAGVINLYSKDFYELCSARMTEDGIMAVWLATWELEEPEMKMLVKAFVLAFPYASLWDSLHPREWLLIGAKQPLEIDLASLEKRMSKQPIAEDLRKIGIDSPAALLSLYMKGHMFLREFAGNSDPVTDDKSVVDYTSPRYARASFGLGERVTGGLRLRSTGSDRSDGAVRDFDRVYTFRESVDRLIVNYGPYDAAAFRKELERWRTTYELRFSQRLFLPEVLGLAQAYVKEGEHQKALDTANHGLSLVSEAASQPILRFLGWLHMALGQYEKALSSLQEALRIRPGDATTHMLLGNVFSGQGNYSKAVEHFQKALEIDPKLDLAKRALAKATTIVSQDGKGTASQRPGELP